MEEGRGAMAARGSGGASNAHGGERDRMAARSRAVTGKGEALIACVLFDGVGSLAGDLGGVAGCHCTVG